MRVKDYFNLARIAYTAYRENAEKNMVTRLPLPQFHELKDTAKNAWLAAANAVAEETQS